MKVIFDTNVILSSFITHGLSARVLDICIDHHKLYISAFIINEVTTKLKEKFKVNTKDINKSKEFLLNNFEVVNPRGTMPKICRDIDDNNILHLAEFIKADLIITGDKDLLVLKKYKKTLIITPRDYMEQYNIVHREAG